MSLPVLKVAAENTVVEENLDFEWDDESYSASVTKSNKKIESILMDLSPKTNLAFSLGCCDWVLERMKIHGDRAELSTLKSYIDALWIWIINDSYIKKDTFEVEERWESKQVGPVRAASLKAMVIFKYCEISHSSRGDESVELVNLVRHISSETEKFDAWVTDRLRFLDGTFPYPSDNEYIIPKVALEYEHNYNRADGPKVVNEQLNAIDHKENEFLYDAKTMKKNGFEGVPYTFG